MVCSWEIIEFLRTLLGTFPCKSMVAGDVPFQNRPMLRPQWAAHEPHPLQEMGRQRLCRPCPWPRWIYGLFVDLMVVEWIMNYDILWYIMIVVCYFLHMLIMNDLMRLIIIKNDIIIDNVTDNYAIFHGMANDITNVNHILVSTSG